jgi:hypothetical protein
MATIADTVIETPDGLFAFRCPSPTGCGSDAHDPESRFTSTGWPSADLAQKRGAQHILEHVDGTPMQDLDGFRAEHGVVVAPVNPVTLTDYLEV